MSLTLFEYLGRPCLTCGKVLDASTPSFEGLIDARNEADPAQPGDVAICGHCGAILIFDVGELLFRLPNEAEKRLIFKSMDDQFLIT